MNIFTQTANERVDGSNHTLTHNNKLSFDIGELVPTLTMEVLPGDKFNIHVESMLRLAPMVAPVMHKMDVYHHCFFVPYRIMWDEWEDFITGQQELVPPHTGNASLTIPDGSVGDYIGLQTAPDGVQPSAFQVAAYAMIYDEYYRAEFIQTTPEFTPLDAAANSWTRALANGAPLRRAWEHDYFTSALPFPQVGNAVTLPLINDSTIAVDVDLTASRPQLVNSSGIGIGTEDVVTNSQGEFDIPAGLVSYIDPKGSLTVDINDEAVNINVLREALALQRYLEKEARSGTRYISHLKSFFDVTSSDKRLDRPEYIGGAKQKVVISEVLTTAETVDNPVGNMQGHGISVGRGNNFNYQAEEYGVIMCITSVRPKTAYQQGMHRQFLRKDRYDFGNPMFAHLGEQAIKVGEIYSDASDQAEFDEVFGYTPQYSEYKYLPSGVHGDFKNSLEYWTMSRIFNSKPVLNASFIECVHDNRIFADTGDSDKIWCQIHFEIGSYRKLPKFGTPSIVG